MVKMSMYSAQQGFLSSPGGLPLSLISPKEESERKKTDVEQICYIYTGLDGT